MAGELNLQLTLGKPNVPVTNAPQLAYLLVEAKPTGAAVNVQMPVNLSMVLDRSGSMSGEKLKNLKQAVKLVLDMLQPQDTVSIVIFDDTVDVLAQSQPAGNRAQLKQLVDGIKDRGGTAMSKGLRAGLAELKKGIQPGRVSRILLLTDGQTYGDEKECRDLAAECAREGVPISALGLGLDWNSTLLEAVGQTSGGMADLIKQPSEVQAEFAKTIQGMQGSVVSNAQLLLRLVAGVSARRVWRVLPIIQALSPKAISDRDVQVGLGDIEKDTGQSILIELMLPARPAGNYRIAQAEIAYDVPAAGLMGEKVRADVLINFTGDAGLLGQYDARVMNLQEKVNVFNLQTRAFTEASEGNVAAATQKLRAAATRLLEMGEGDLAAAAEAEARRLEQGQGMSDAGKNQLQYQTRKLTQKLS